MRLITLAAAALLASGACNGKRLELPTNPSNTPSQGELVRLRAGETILAEGGRLELRFDGVSGDSRCPRDVRCPWAGSVSGSLSARPAAGPWRSATFEVMEGTSAPGGVLSLAPWVLTVLAVEPYPMAAGSRTPPDAYVVQLRVTRAE